jgi:hypothetical protein
LLEKAGKTWKMMEKNRLKVSTSDVAFLKERKKKSKNNSAAAANTKPDSFSKRLRHKHKTRT